jgi:hypothetical protein
VFLSKDKVNEYKVLSGKLKKRNHLWKLGVAGSIILKFVSNQ